VEVLGRTSLGHQLKSLVKIRMKKLMTCHPLTAPFFKTMIWFSRPEPKSNRQIPSSMHKLNDLFAIGDQVSLPSLVETAFTESMTRSLALLQSS
jgi:hypothetical protein